MTLWRIIFALLAASFPAFPFVTSFSGPKSNYVFSSGSGSGSTGGILSGRVYLVAPELRDCSNITNCDTLSSYSTMGTTRVNDVTFSFLPGIHKLSQRWLIAESGNITFRGEEGSADDDNESSDKVDIVCDMNFSGSSAIEVSHSVQVVIEGIRISHCDSSVSSLFLRSSISATIRNVSIACSYNMSFGGELFSSGLFFSGCKDITIKHSEFTNCNVGIKLHRFQYGIIDNVVSLHNSIGLFLVEFLEVEVSKSYFVNNYTNIDVVSPGGSIKFMENFCQGGVVGWQIYVFYTESFVLKILDSTVRLEKDTNFGIVIEGSHNGFIIPNNATDGNHPGSQRLRIHNVTIENINSDLSRNSTLTDSAALRVISFRSLEISNSTIRNNWISGIRLCDSTIMLQGDVYLINNHGINGGGIALFSNSFILLDLSAKLLLSRNRAEKFGGGIYISQSFRWSTIIMYCNAYTIGSHPYYDCPSSKEIAHAKLTGHESFGFNLKPIVLDGNRADLSGHNVYGGYVQSCTEYLFIGYCTTKVSSFGENESGSCNQTNVSSNPVKLLPCIENCISDSEYTRQQNIPPLFPGQDFSLSVAAVGQQNGLTPAIILFSSDDIILDTTSSDTTQHIGAQCTKVSKTLALRAYVNQALLTIAIADESLPTTVNTPIVVHVEVLPCPQGFNLSDSICHCTKSLEDIATCNITNQNIQRTDNSWLLPKNDSTLIFENCPFDYCSGNAFHSDNPDEQCDHNRGGILCGKCLSGYSLMLGSNKCANCTEQVWKLPIIVLGSILAGIGLVAVLIGLNLTISVGTMNGLIFFVNIVKIYETIFVSDTFHPLLQYCISWLNLDLGIPTCFFHGMTACDKAGLQFVFPLYLLSILFLVIIICKAGQWRGFSSSRFIRFISRKVTSLIGSKAIPVLATLILLSYMKLLRTTIMIFHRATIITADCEENTSIPTCENFAVWYMDGNINYTSACHGILFGVAVGIFSPLLILFTSFMLFFPLMEKYFTRFNCWSSWHMRLKPWYDAYGGPYKDEYRSWTGVLLLVRCVLALVAAFENNRTINISVLAWICLFLISLLSLIQVYKKFFLNALEIMYLAFLLLMAYLSTTNDSQIDAVLSVVLLLLVFITLYHIYHQLVKLKFAQNQIDKVKSTCRLKLFNEKKTMMTEIDKVSDTKESVHPSTLVNVENVDITQFRESMLAEEL